VCPSQRLPKLCGGEIGLGQFGSGLKQVDPGVGRAEGEDLQEKSPESVLCGRPRVQPDYKVREENSGRKPSVQQSQPAIQQCLSPSPTKNTASNVKQPMQGRSEVPADLKLSEFPG